MKPRTTWPLLVKKAEDTLGKRRKEHKAAVEAAQKREASRQRLLDMFEAYKAKLTQPTGRNRSSARWMPWASRCTTSRTNPAQLQPVAVAWLEAPGNQLNRGPGRKYHAGAMILPDAFGIDALQQRLTQFLE